MDRPIPSAYLKRQKFTREISINVNLTNIFDQLRQAVSNLGIDLRLSLSPEISAATPLACANRNRVAGRCEPSVPRVVGEANSSGRRIEDGSS
jgi:hypothetical protein